MKKRLTEELPSSGGQATGCDHAWQFVEGLPAPAGFQVVVCKKDKCGASKLVEKPKMQESKGQKPVLLG